jgi:diphosphomevalonate decarboxylase
MSSGKSVTWSAPANIALIKYWGKHGDQLPGNPSVSMTLSESVTTTTVNWKKSGRSLLAGFRFDGLQAPSFAKRVEEYLGRVEVLLPGLAGHSLDIESSNNFPHSSGISSSASFMSSLALCLTSAEEAILGVYLPQPDFLRKASGLARLGSGSAARSVYPAFALWGETAAVPESSDTIALPVGHLVHPKFCGYRDAILVVSSAAKSVSSSAGHKLMESNPFAPIRFRQAGENINTMMKILSSGNQEQFVTLVEEEAMTLHGLIQASAGGPVLIEPGTLSIIRKLRQYRKDTGSQACFTLDAGPNVHLLYPEEETSGIHDFIRSHLLPHCENGRWIDDRIGTGPKCLSL